MCLVNGSFDKGRFDKVGVNPNCHLAVRGEGRYHPQYYALRSL